MFSFLKKQNRKAANVNYTPLTFADLIPDEPLKPGQNGKISDNEDLLHHRVIARRVAELASEARGKVNIALFAPWGAGKSSFNELLREELVEVAPDMGHVTYDAWRNSGPGFHSNFLDSFSEQVEGKKGTTRRQLFDSSTAIELPFGNNENPKMHVKNAIKIVLLVLFIGFILVPLIWTIFLNALKPYGNFLSAVAENIAGWAGFAASGTLLVTILLSLFQLSKVTIHRSAPSFVTQFANLFDDVLNKGKKKRYVVFVDELDRCSPQDVMIALEGLRTFLGNDRCVFVVAFDREAVASTIAQNIKHSVPDAPSSPYYLTSGEYLDKIFQFQLSLPPQSPHTFRPFAMSLVKTKGGVWEKLAEGDEGQLERVVTLLSPMHLASPRRTKVLLNDYAVNLRVFESLGFNWRARAEEIAILTVFQTEFPRFAADLEREPSLISWMRGDSVPVRPSSKKIVEQYQVASNKAESDKDKTAGDAIVVSGTSRVKAVNDLLDNLHRYIERLGDLKVPTPGADLIMMHSDQDLLRFSESSVYRLVQVAVDMPRAAVLEALSEASKEDCAAAVEYLCSEAERETPEAAKNLRLLVAEIAAGLPGMAKSQALRLLDSGLVNLASSITTLAAQGYANALVVAFNLDIFELFLADLSLEALNEFAHVLIADLDKSSWVHAEDPLSDALFEDSSELADSIRTLLERRANESDRGLTDNQIQAIVKSFEIELREFDEADEVDEETISSRASELQETLLRNYSNIEVILESWESIPTRSPLRADLLFVLRSIRDEDTGYITMHNALLRADQDRGYVAESNEHLLEAIAQLPLKHAFTSSEQLDADAEVRTDVKEAALRAMLELALGTTTSQDKELAAHCVEKIASFKSDPILLGELKERVISASTQPWSEYSDTFLETQVSLLKSLSVVDPDSQAQIAKTLTLLFSEGLKSLQEDEEMPSFNAMLQQVANLEKEFLEGVVSCWEQESVWERKRPELGLEVLIDAQRKAISFGVSVIPVPVEHINGLQNDIDDLASKWLLTFPSGENVVKVRNFKIISDVDWKEYSNHASQESKGIVWEQLRVSAQADEFLSKMKTVAGTGLSAGVVDEAVERITEATTVARRRPAVREFLTIPPSSVGKSTTVRVIRAMAQEGKASEFIDGVAIARHISQELDSRTVSTLKPYFEKWAEGSSNLIRSVDRQFLLSRGLLPKKRLMPLGKSKPSR